MRLAETRHGPPVRVLIVEDEGVVAMDLAATLERLGYAVVGSVARGEDAIGAAEQQRPDLIMMDIRLAGKLDGIQAAEAIQAQQDVPFVFLTAYTDEETIDRAKRIGPYAYAVKPYEERELRSAIEIALYKHRMERRVRASEARLDATLRSISEAVIATDPDGRVTFLNRAAGDLLATDAESVYGRPLPDVLHITDPAGRPVRVVLEDDTTRVAGHLDGHLGRNLPVEGTMAPVLSGPERLGWVLVLRDVTTQHLAEAALRELASIVTSADAGIISTDETGTVRTWNSGAVRLLKTAEAQAVGTAVEDLLRVDDETVQKALQAAVRNGTNGTWMAATLRRPDGRALPVGIHVSPLHDAAGKRTGSTLILHDAPVAPHQEPVVSALRRHLLQRARELI